MLQHEKDKAEKKLILTSDRYVKINIIKKYKFERKKESKKDNQPMRSSLESLSPVMCV